MGNHALPRRDIAHVLDNQDQLSLLHVSSKEKEVHSQPSKHTTIMIGQNRGCRNIKVHTNSYYAMP